MRHAIIFSVLFLCLSAFGQGTVRRVDTLAQLLAIDPYQVGTSTNLSYEVGGYTVSGDWGAPRTADWVSAGGLTTNRVCVFAATSGQWRFRDCENGSLDVRSAGAVPDDGVDDYAAIQETILTVAAYGGGTVRVPPGVFLLSAPIRTWGTNSVDIIGASFSGGPASGLATTTLKRSGSDTNAILIVGTNITYNGPVISGIFFDGDNVAQGIQVSRAANITIERNQIRNFTQYAVDIYGVTSRIKDNKFVTSSTNGPIGATYGVRLGGGSGHYIGYNQFYGLGIGIYNDVSHSLMEANTFEPGMIAVWKPTMAGDGATPFIGNFVEDHPFPIEIGTDDAPLDYDFSTLPLIGNNFAGAGSGPIRAHNAQQFIAIGNYLGSGLEITSGVTNAIVFGNSIPWAAGTNYSNDAQNTLDLNRMHYGALLRTPRIYLGSDATFSSGPIVMDLSGTFPLTLPNALSLYDTVLNFDDNARLWSPGASFLQTAGSFGINMQPNAGLSVNYTDLGGNTFQSFIGDGNTQVAADVGGSLAFGARWQTNATSVAAITEIAGRRVNATHGSVASYLDFYTRKTDGNWVKGLRVDENGDTIFQQGASLGAVLHDYWTPYMLNVRDYGATPDDGTDDAAAIQAAITAAEASATFGTVYIPPGVYRINSTIRISKAVRLTGSTFRETSLGWYPTTSTNFMLQIQPTSGSIIGAAVENLIFTMYGNGNGIGMTNAGRSLIQNCRFYEFNNYGIRTYGSPDSRILRNVFTGNNTNIDCVAIALGASSGQSVQHNTINYSGIGILYEESQTVDINHNTFEYNFIGIDRPNGNHQSGGQIGNNFFEFNEYAHLRLGVGKYAGSFHTTLTNSQQFGSLKISGNTLAVGSAASTNTIVIVDEHDNVSFIGNEIYGKIRITTNANNLTFIGNGYNTFLGGVGSGSGEVIFDGERTGIFADGDVSRNDAAFEVASTTKPFVLPRLSSAAISALTNPIVASLAFNTNAWELQTYDGTNWLALGSGGGGPTNGTAIQIDTGSFMTTADLQDTAEVNVTRTSDVVTWSIITNSIAGTKLAAALDLSAQTSVRHPQSASPSLTLAGMLGFDTDFTGASRGIFKFHDGTEELAIAAFEGDAAAQYEVLIGGGGSDNPAWGLLSTNSITAGFYSWLGTLGGSSYTFTNGVTNASGTVSAALAAGSNISITNNNGLLTISAVTSTNSGTVVSVDGGSAMATANFIDNSAIGFTQTGNDVTATIVDSSISTNKIDSTFYGLLMASSITNHNDLAGIQGGTSGEYYHLTSSEYTDLGTLLTSDPYLPLSAGPTKALTNTLHIVTPSPVVSLSVSNTGDSFRRFHLDSANKSLYLGGGSSQEDVVLSWPSSGRDFRIGILESPGVWDDVVTVASNLVAFAQPLSVIDEVFGAGWDGSKDVPTKNAIWDQLAIVSGSSVTNHNDLSGLQGGTSAEYYHLTSTQHGVTTNFAAARKRIGFWDATQFKPVTNSAAAAIPAVRGNGFHNYTFSATVDQSVVVHGIVPATGAVDLTGGIKVNMILTSSGTSTTNVYSFEVMRWTSDLDTDGYDTAVNTTNIVSATSGIPTTVTATITTIDSMTNGDPFSLRVTRLSASNTSDTAAETTQTYSLEMTED